MYIAKIADDIQKGKFLILSGKVEFPNNTKTSSPSRSFFLYYDKHYMLIPLTTIPSISSKSITDFLITLLDKYSSPLSGAKFKGIELSIRKEMREEHQSDIVEAISQIGCIKHKNKTVFDDRVAELNKLGYKFPVIYLPMKASLLEKKFMTTVNVNALDRFGLTIEEDYEIVSKTAGTSAPKPNTAQRTRISGDIKERLLDCDKVRCNLGSYDKALLTDITRGHWDLFEHPDEYGYDPQNSKMIAKDPRKDIKGSGVIGIDFGTRSTVVVQQDSTNEIRPIRIGLSASSTEVRDADYENPTIVSFMNIENFLKDYMASVSRPLTSCEDIFVSYSALNDFKNCSTENFFAYFSALKQWANNEKSEVEVLDTQNKSIYKLMPEISLEAKTINPIEIYAYYIGLYINNMTNGIYLKYIMSFPVKYSMNTKELIRKSFEAGLKKSLPETVVNDEECMKNFSVKYEISEPAAYAVAALENAGFRPKNEKEKYLYGIFDFGGGTTDFDYGVWRGADEVEWETYNCAFVLECFGADSDVKLGGENILEMLAYNVFRDNKDMAFKKRIACALPIGETPFIGGENLINNSQSANRNLSILKEAFRPLWEQHESWGETYKHEEQVDGSTSGEYLELQLYNFDGEQTPNCKFEIDTEKLIGLIKDRIKQGVDSFFTCLEKSLINYRTAKTASETTHVFLAGNSSRSVFVKEIFEDKIKELTEEYNRINKEYGYRDTDEDYFKLIMPPDGSSDGLKYIPNAKTSVAYGLVKSRPGSNIRVVKNYQTSSDTETIFKYYLGVVDRNEKFVCKLAHDITENGKTGLSYNIWHKFGGAGSAIVRIYYTNIPGADVREDISIDDVPFHEITIEPALGSYLYIRAVSPDEIEYAVATSESDLDNITATKLKIG